jgi:hypothetical protein
MKARRNRGKHRVPFEERLERAAGEARQAAEKLPHGQEREALLKKARQAEMAAHLNELLTSPGAPSPR